MLLQKNFFEEHIRELQKKSHRDPVLLERAVYAFGLLEALTKVGMPFIFKGGTCLMLLMKHPRRLSTDIDIIVEPGTDLDKYLDRASEIFPFKALEEQKRVGKNNIEKRHFKFTYDSPISNRPLYILLDVLLEHNCYTELIQKEIQNDLLLTEPEYLTVSLPSANCLLADKLTAFAPHTIGIPLNIGKDMEVMKQFYDVSSLLEIFTDFQQIGPTYEKIAAGRVAKIMYMAACLLSDTEYLRVNDYMEFLDMKVEQGKLASLRYMRKVNPEAYAYIIKTDRILTKIQD